MRLHSLEFLRKVHQFVIQKCKSFHSAQRSSFYIHCSSSCCQSCPCSLCLSLHRRQSEHQVFQHCLCFLYFQSSPLSSQSCLRCPGHCLYLLDCWRQSTNQGCSPQSLDQSHKCLLSQACIFCNHRSQSDSNSHHWIQSN